MSNSERDRLAEEATKHLAERYDGRYHPKIVGQSWFKEGFDAGVESEKKKAKGLYWAASKIGTQCLNTGLYGPLNIQPGKCDCSSCELKKALAAYKQESEGSEGSDG